jgi:hypothetical protein
MGTGRSTVTSPQLLNMLAEPVLRPVLRPRCCPMLWLLRPVARTLREGAVVLVVARAKVVASVSATPSLGVQSRGVVVRSREQEDALWQQVFMVQPARRREFEPVERMRSTKRRKRRPVPWPPGTG